MLDSGGEKIIRVLGRKSVVARQSVFTRLAAETKIDVQLMAANIDTLFIVSSCNEDFNESRLERYQALTREAGVDWRTASFAVAVRLPGQAAGAAAFVHASKNAFSNTPTHPWL